MIAADFQYHRPTSLAEALQLLAKNSDAKILAGGQSLIPLMKFRLAQPAHVVDLARVRELSGVREENGTVIIGSMTTHHEIESSDKCPLLAQAAAQIGDVQVRNLGTIGGSAAHADPAADYPAAFLALDAEFVVAGPNGQRTIKAADFFTDMLTTALQSGEILTAIRVAPTMSSGASYQKFAQKASGFAICGVAAILAQQNGKASRVRIGITGVAPKAYRATAVERALNGKPLNPDTIAAAAAKAADGIEPLNDIHASGDFRKELARVYTRRALEAAL